MSEIMDLRGYPAKEIKCYKCEAKSQLLVHEGRDSDTGDVVFKKFICASCAWGIERSKS